jgi:hypothetical protein
MYRCQQCGCIAPPRTRSFLVVVQTRRKVYPEREIVKLIRERLRTRKPKVVVDPGSVGWERVREARVCPRCATELDGRPVPASARQLGG